MSELNVHCKYDALVDPRSLKPHPKNRNRHSKEQISRLSKIIAHQGQRAPVVVSNLSGCIVKGHGTTLSVIEFDNLPPEEFPNNTRIASNKIAVVYQDFPDEETEYQFLIGDNAIAEWAELDLSGINLDIQEIGPFDIELLGLKDFTVEPLEKFDVVQEVNRGDENAEWVGMPEFETAEKQIKLTIFFRDEQHREDWVREKGIDVTKRHSGQWATRL